MRSCIKKEEMFDVLGWISNSSGLGEIYSRLLWEAREEITGALMEKCTFLLAVCVV